MQSVAGVAGLEPTLTVLETVALPLNYTPKYLHYLISIITFRAAVNAKEEIIPLLSYRRQSLQTFPKKP